MPTPYTNNGFVLQQLDHAVALLRENGIKMSREQREQYELARTILLDNDNPRYSPEELRDAAIRDRLYRVGSSGYLAPDQTSAVQYPTLVEGVGRYVPHMG